MAADGTSGTEDLGVGPELGAWLTGRLGDPGPFRLIRLSGGNSNETLLLRGAAVECIMRRPPREAISPSAHSMEREHRVLSALDGTGVPAPRPLGLAGPDDPDGPFLLMERIPGQAIADDLPAAYPPGPASVDEVGRRAVEALAKLHSVDWQASGLDTFGRPDGFLERQVERWSGQYRSYQVRDLPDFDFLAGWLGENLPPAQPAGILHGDFHLDNCLFTERPPIGVAAILDWEMATIGDPLLDLGLVLGFWGPDRPEPTAMAMVQGATRIAGTCGRAELAAHYAEHSGRSVEHLDWYVCLAFWKLAAIIEGAYAQFVAGTNDSAYARSLGENVPLLLAEARAVAVAA
jgi:aminoglycoside phosphotransferase (APT) family kinase protein